MLNSKNLLMLIARNVIISLIVMAIAFVAIFFLKNEIEKITNTIVLNHKLETDLKNRTEFLSILENEAKIIGDNELLINNAFLTSDNISLFINKLDDLISSDKITQLYKFDTPIPSSKESPFPLATISYTNNLNSSDLETFSSYLKNFEKLPYFTKIESLEISSQDKLGWVGVSNISFKATLFTKATQ